MSNNYFWHLQLAKEIKFFSEMLKTSIRVSGKTDKQIYLELEMDAGNFSRTVNGFAPFPGPKIIKLCEIMGNDIPIIWQAMQRGYELLPKTEAEPINELREKVKSLESKINTLESHNKVLKELIFEKPIK